MSSQSRLERLQEKADAAGSANNRDQLPTTRKERLQKYADDNWKATEYAFLALEDNIWYYRDRMSVPRGPCPLTTLRTAWINGVIDENTLVWGQGLEEWVPVRNVRALPALIRTVEAQFLTWMKRKVDSIKSLQLKKVPMNGYKESESTIMVAGDKRMQTGVQGTLNAALHITGPPLAVDETRGSTTEAYSGLACLSLALPVE